MLVLATTAAAVPTRAPAAEGALGVIRAAADGAGPSHLFWLSGPRRGRDGADLVGVVDPLVSAIRLYAVRRGGRGEAGSPRRLAAIGACALPIDFTPWRVHQFRRYVILEGMPTPAGNPLDVRAARFKSAALKIDRNLLTKRLLPAIRDAGARIDTATWDPASAPRCGRPVASARRAGAVASYVARRGRRLPARTIILTNKPNALASRRPLVVRSHGRSRLYSARELEPAGALRFVQTTEGAPGEDGLVRVTQRVLVFRNAHLVRALDFDESRVRSKLGQRPLAVLPSGEVLMMGRLAGESRFSLRSCGRVAMRAGPEFDLCPAADVTDATSSPAAKSGAAGERAAAPGMRADATGIAAPGSAGDAAAIFARVRPYASTTWSVDAGRLPDACRGVTGCAVRGQSANFVPIRGIRLSRGRYTRTGAPYAQTGGLDDVRKSLATSEEEFTSALARVTEGARGVPGNLDDDYVGEVGIDCSALVQIAWNGESARQRLWTSALQGRRHIAYRCDHRVADAGALKPGDVIGLNVRGGVIHMALYAASLAFDGASTSWLVLEATSGCDGVCWSVYDPGFFNGWGIYRAAGRTDQACPAPDPLTSIANSPIPGTFGAWRAMLQRPGAPQTAAIAAPATPPAGSRPQKALDVPTAAKPGADGGR